MMRATTYFFVIGAILFGGLLAGMAANKVLVQLPAWSEAGVTAWATFTSTADRGLGLILFPVIGAASLLLSIAAAIGFYFDRNAARAGTIPVYLAPLLAIAALAVTVFLLEPARLNFVQAGANVSELLQVFARVVQWWDVKALLHVLSFGANLWALATIVPAQPAARPQADRSSMRGAQA